MNLPALTRRLFCFPAKALRSPGPPPTIEPLEARIAPATLVSSTVVTFQDKYGDAATVTISKPLFTAGNVNKVFAFDTGSVSGDNSTPQQLQLLDIDALGQAASGMNITITATPVSGSPGVVNVGFINSSGIDLGAVSVAGDLGRINAGNLVFATPALKSLTVESLGAQGAATQQANGNLNTLIAGSVGSITVNGDIDQASIGIGGGARGILSALLVTGSINGGAAAYSGSIRTQGGISVVQIDGSINGGVGGSSGVIGTAGRIVSATVDGSVIGAFGTFSGAILATKSIGAVQIDGDLTGGEGMDSGQVGTASTLGNVIVDGSVQGGSGSLSGVILATGEITSVTIANGLVGGSGPNSGQIGTGNYAGTITIGEYGLATPTLLPGPSPLDGAFQGIEAGSGANSGVIVAGYGINNVFIYGEINGSFSNEAGIAHPFAAGNGGGVISAGGGISNITVTESVIDGGILSGADIGTVTITGSLNGSEIDALGSIGAISVNANGPGEGVISPGLHPLLTPGSGNGIESSTIIAAQGSIGSILAGGGSFANAIGYSTISAAGNIGSIQAQSAGAYGEGIVTLSVTAGSVGNITVYSDSSPISGLNVVATHGIGNIYAYTDGNDAGITGSTFRAGAGIESIGAEDPFASQGNAIFASGFDAGGNIGPITTTGSITSSVFIAGIDLGPGFGTTGAGTFNNTSAAGFGFGSGTSSIAASIGAINVSNSAEHGPALIVESTFLAGVHGAGLDHTFGTKDDVVATGSSIGLVNSQGGLQNDFIESGSIGATNTVDTAAGGAIIGATYIATDSSVTSAGIGGISVNATIPENASSGENYGIYNSTFISNAGIGDINVSLSSELYISSENAGIGASTFMAGHAIGALGVENLVPATGFAYGIEGSTFNAGYGGYGGIGNITATVTDHGELDTGSTAAIYNSDFDSNLCACMSASMGAITAQNYGSGSSAAGIADSVFRVHGNMGSITSTVGSTTGPAIEGSTFSAFGSIAQIGVFGSVLADANGPSRFLAGYDIGTGMTFGGQDLSARSLALQGGQSIGNVAISGNFQGSDIIASVNPGAGYVFGSAANTNVGAGGSIGVVDIGFYLVSVTTPFTSDHATSHAIEAGSFFTGSQGATPTVAAFGFSADVPVVLYVDGSSGDVRITTLADS